MLISRKKRLNKATIIIIGLIMLLLLCTSCSDKGAQTLQPNPTPETVGEKEITQNASEEHSDASKGQPDAMEGQLDTSKDRPDAPEPLQNEELNVYFFHTSEEADAILLSASGVNIMIDTGVIEDAPELLDNLREKGIDHLDILVLTHPDKDHIGGAAQVLNTIQTDRLIRTAAVKNSEEQMLLNNAEQRENMIIDVPAENEKFEFGELEITVYPPKQAEYEEINDYSIAVLATYGGRSFFFPGDAEAVRLAELLEEDLPQVDVYKLPHHGRDSKKAGKLLDALNPKFCVVTALKPEKAVRKDIEEIGATTISTLEGEIKCTVNASSGELRIDQLKLVPAGNEN